MKTIFNKTIIIITAGLFLSMNVNAKDNENPKSVLIADASKTIKEHIKFPNLLMHFNDEEKVKKIESSCNIKCKHKSEEERETRKWRNYFSFQRILLLL